MTVFPSRDWVRSEDNNVTNNVPIRAKPLTAPQYSKLSARMGIHRTGGLVRLIPTRLRGMSWDILHVEPVPASCFPTLAHVMRPRSEKKGTICLSVILQ